jgi:hypothetical protein
VSDLASAVEAVRATTPGADLVFRVRRGDKEMDVTVKVGVIPFQFLVGLT